MALAQESGMNSPNCAAFLRWH